MSTTPDLTALLGFRQAQVMRHLWAHGPATVRELHTALASEVSYTTMLMICRRLFAKGLLERRRVSEEDGPTRAKQADVYAPQLSEAEFLRTAITTAPEPPDTPMAAIPHQPSMGASRSTIPTIGSVAAKRALAPRAFIAVPPPI